MVSGSKVSLLLGSGSAERVLGLLCSVGPWCKLAGQTGGFEGTETATKSACPFRAWSMSSLIMHGLGCVADVSYSGVCVLESIFLVCSKKIPALCTLEVAWTVFPSAAEMRHQDKEVSVVPDFPFYLPYFFFLISPQRDLAESLIIDASIRQRQASDCYEDGLGDSCCIKGVYLATSCLLFILTSAWSRSWSYFCWLTTGVSPIIPKQIS